MDDGGRRLHRVRPPLHSATPYATTAHLYPQSSTSAFPHSTSNPSLSSSLSSPLPPSFSASSSIPLPVSSFVIDRRVYTLGRQSRSRSDSNSSALPPPFTASSNGPSPAVLPPSGAASTAGRPGPSLSNSPLPSLSALAQMSSSLSSLTPSLLNSPRSWWAALSSLPSRMWAPSSSPSYSSYTYHPVHSSASPPPTLAVTLSTEGGKEDVEHSSSASSPSDSGEEGEDEEEGEGEEDDSGWEGESDDLPSSDGDDERDDIDLSTPARPSRSSSLHRHRRRVRRQRRQRSKALRVSPLWAICGCPQPCFSAYCPAPSAVYRTVSRSVSRCGSLLSSPERCLSSCWSMSGVKDAELWYKELPSSTREKLLFLLSSTLGTVLFFFLFESFMIIGLTDLEARDSAFIGSYLLAYVISIAWQHALHRLLVFSHQPYCLSLFHTYASYSFSLLCFAALGALLIHGLHWPPRLVVAITLPCSAVFNYYLLRACMQCSDRWEETREDGRRQSSTSASSNPAFSAADDVGYLASTTTTIGTTLAASQSSPRRQLGNSTASITFQPALPPHFSAAYAAYAAGHSSSNRPPSPFYPSATAPSPYSLSQPQAYYASSLQPPMPSVSLTSSTPPPLAVPPVPPSRPTHLTPFPHPPHFAR